MVQQVGALAEQGGFVLRDRRQRGLDTLFAHLLRDAACAGFEQARRIAVRRPLALAPRDKCVQVRQERRRRRREATGALQMAGGSLRVRQHQQRVVVAVCIDRDEFEHMARAFALGPQALLASAEERHAPAGERGFQRFTVHVAQHQHAQVRRVLHHDRQQAITLAPVQPARIETGRSVVIRHVAPRCPAPPMRASARES